MIKQMPIEQVKSGMTINRHGFHWEVLANDHDAQGNGLPGQPRPRQVLTVNPLGDAPKGYRGAQFGFMPGEVVTVNDVSPRPVAAVAYDESAERQAAREVLRNPEIREDFQAVPQAPGRMGM